MFTPFLERQECGKADMMKIIAEAQSEVLSGGKEEFKCLIDQNARTIPPVDNAACTLHETASSFIGFLRRGDRGTHNVVSGVAYGNWIRFKEQGTWRHMIVANISGMEIYRDFGVEVMLNRIVKPVGDLYKLLIYHDRTVFQIAFQEEIT
ncbi:hypothetical protein BT69DRAFT_1304007 [Atractiella rhizophila]|nr:hypothetical protein BT69DRAFT_1304007 [Atractiella rhizophila]